MKIILVLLVLGIFLITSGCSFPLSDSSDTSARAAAFAEKTVASQRDADRMVNEDPQNATAWCIRGMSYNNVLGQYDVAIESYNRGLALDPQNAICWLGKSVTLQNMRQYDEANACFETSCRLDPTLRDYQIHYGNPNVNYFLTFRSVPSAP